MHFCPTQLQGPVTQNTDHLEGRLAERTLLPRSSTNAAGKDGGGEGISAGAPRLKITSIRKRYQQSKGVAHSPMHFSSPQKQDENRSLCREQLPRPRWGCALGRELPESPVSARRPQHRLSARSSRRLSCGSSGSCCATPGSAAGPAGCSCAPSLGSPTGLRAEHRAATGTRAAVGPGAPVGPRPTAGPGPHTRPEGHTHRPHGPGGRKAAGMPPGAPFQGCPAAA